MKYLKVWTSFREVIDPLQDAEKGRLFDMMLRYAEKCEEPSSFAGNERFIWPAAKQLIDLTAAKSETLRQNGLKGGRPVTKENQGEANESKNNQGEANESLKEKKRNNKEKEGNEKDISDRFDRFWSAYPRKVAKPDARKKFLALNPDDELLGIMLAAIEAQKRSEQWSKDNGQFVPYPSTWIHQRRWEDEVKPVAVISPKRVVAQDYDQRDYSGVQDEILNRQAMEIEEMIRRKGAG